MNLRHHSSWRHWTHQNLTVSYEWWQTAWSHFVGYYSQDHRRVDKTLYGHSSRWRHGVAPPQCWGYNGVQSHHFSLPLSGSQTTFTIWRSAQRKTPPTCPPQHPTTIYASLTTPGTSFSCFKGHYILDFGLKFMECSCCWHHKYIMKMGIQGTTCASYFFMSDTKKQTIC